MFHICWYVQGDQDQYTLLLLTLTLNLPLKSMLKGGEKCKFKVIVKAKNMGPVRSHC